MKIIALIALPMLISITLNGQSIIGQWNGILEVQGSKLRIVFHITPKVDGYSASMDSPDQGAFGLPVSSTNYTHPQLKMAIPEIGMEYEGTFDGNKTISGQLNQAGQTFKMDLTRVVENEKTEKESLAEFAFYTETPISLQTSSGQIFGTLTTPKTSTILPVALIIAGSGPTDRDCNIAGMKTDAYKKLAYGLAENNIASVRYDKRGIAESHMAGKDEADLRFEDYVRDVIEWIQVLKQDKRFSKVILIGHSEGSLIGMLASTAADQLISIAGPGQSADKTLKEQLSTQPQEIQDMCFPMLDSLTKGKTVADVNPMLNSLFRLSVQPYLISWFKYDPQIEISKLSIPVQIIQGTKDLQVTIEDANRLSRSNPNSNLIFIENMNHVLKTIDGDVQENVASYNNPTLPLSAKLVNVITDFILKK